MGTGPFNVYNKASEFQTNCGTLLAADFTAGVAANIFTGFKTVKAAFVTFNADIGVTTVANTMTVDINADGTITVNQFDIIAVAAITAKDCSWMVIGN